MKASLVSLLLVLFFGVISHAQIRLSGLGGYTFDDKFNTGGISGKVQGTGHWGIGVEYMIHPYYGLELQYQRMVTDVNYTWIGIENRTTEIDFNYIMLGGNRYLPVSDVVWPYGGVGLGVAIISGNNDSTTEFAWQFKAGGMFLPNNKISIKARAQLTSIVQGIGGGLYFGTGGSGIDINTYSSIYQFGLTGGIVIHLGGSASAPQTSEGLRR